MCSYAQQCRNGVLSLLLFLNQPDVRALVLIFALCRERDSLLERLEALEDESSAVKVSLVQLLQEKSATNKTLALENWRLTRKVRRTGGVQSAAASQ